MYMCLDSESMLYHQLIKLPSTKYSKYTHNYNEFRFVLVRPEDPKYCTDNLEKVADDRCPHVAKKIKHLPLYRAQLKRNEKHTL